ncbi:MAG: winged helix-turn-helix domain-containing protein, partial [Anaerolineae bacterium]
MTRLRIHLLGSFRVFRDERPLDASEWRSQQVRTILKLLLVRRGHIVPADQLLDVLWPDNDSQSARRRLHVRVSQLRRALGSDHSYVLCVEGGYTFNLESDY